MRVGPVVSYGVLVVVLVSTMMMTAGLPGSSGAQAPSTPANHSAPVARSTFVENVGQLRNEQIRYYLSTPGFSAGFAEGAVFWSLTQGSTGSPSTLLGGSASLGMHASVAGGVLVRLSFAGSNRVVPRGSVEQPYRTNFLIGE